LDLGRSAARLPTVVARLLCRSSASVLAPGSAASPCETATCHQSLRARSAGTALALQKSSLDRCCSAGRIRGSSYTDSGNCFLPFPPLLVGETCSERASRRRRVLPSRPRLVMATPPCAGLPATSL